jgi:hypothetical protein
MSDETIEVAAATDTVEAVAPEAAPADAAPEAPAV